VQSVHQMLGCRERKRLTRMWRSGITKIADVIQACRLGARTADCRRGYSVDRV
jgi:hypothetical protein